MLLIEFLEYELFVHVFRSKFPTGLFLFTKCTRKHQRLKSWNFIGLEREIRLYKLGLSVPH